MLTRKRLLATAAIPLLAAGLTSGNTLAAPTQDATAARVITDGIVLAQADGGAAPAECPPGTTPSADGCMAAEPQAAPDEGAAPQEAPAEAAPAPEEPAEAAPPPAAEEPEAPAAEAPATPEAVPAPEESQPENAPPAEQPAAEEAPASEPPAEAPAPLEAPVEEAPAAEEPAAEPPAAEGQAPAAQEPAPVPEAIPAPEEAPAAEDSTAPEEAAPAAEEAAPAAETTTEEAVPQIQEEPAASDPEAPAPASEEEAPAEEDADPAEDLPSGEEAAPTTDQPEDETPAVEAPAGEAPVEDEAPVEEAPAGQIEPEEGDDTQMPDASGGKTAGADGAAPATEPERLPVEGGAPILDSAKEQPVQAQEAPAEAEAGGEAEAQTNPQDPEEMERLRQRIEMLEAQQGQRPESDAAAQAIVREFSRPVEYRAILEEEGQRLGNAPEFQRPDNVTVINRTENRYVYEINNQYVVENNDRDRLALEAQDIYYEELPRGRIREVVVRENGSEIVTIRNRYGDIIQRSRIRPNGEEIVLFYAPEQDTGERYVYRDPATYLPPLQLTVPVEQYIYDSSRADSYTDYVNFLEQPPVEPVTEIYSVEEVKRSARVRDIMPRVDLDNITFDFGSASIGDSQIPALEEIAQAISAMLEEDPSEVFLIEGHTDAVGTQQANLVLSDRRAEAVAIALTNVFGIPPENLQTQGYGERYLKVATEEPERLNRRVTIRRITPLVQQADAR